MPRGDRTGPYGYGPMSGQGAGFCAGYDMPGYANAGFYRGGMRMGRRARGGRHSRFYGGMGRGWMGNAAYAVPYPADMSPAEKTDMLKTREAWLQEQLEEVQQEMGDIQKDTKEKPAK